MDIFINDMCQGHPKRTLVFLGTGYWRGNYLLPGRRSSPKGKAIAVALRRHGCTVQFTSELRTSKVMLQTGKSKILIPYRYVQIVKKAALSIMEVLKMVVRTM
jgi:hypothetical protein